MDVAGNPAVFPPRLWRDPQQHFVAALTSPWYRLVTELLATVTETTATFFRDQGCRAVPMPVTAGSVSSPIGLGSDSLPVSVELFEEEVYLADSMQFQLELFLRHGFDGVWYLMPTFRGEAHDETHLNQFFHSEAEIVGGFDDVIVLVEAYLVALAKALLQPELSSRLISAAGDIEHIQALAESSGLPRMRHADAVDLLEGQDNEVLRTVPGGWRMPTRLGERRLIAEAGGAVWLTHPPAGTVPFYQAREPGTHNALAADLLMGPGEVVGCGERHQAVEDVLRALDHHGVDAASYEWYLEMKRLAPMRTAGFGLGVERLLMWALRHDDIRDLHSLPRIRGVASWA